MERGNLEQVYVQIEQWCTNAVSTTNETSVWRSTRNLWPKLVKIHVMRWVLVTNYILEGLMDWTRSSNASFP